MLSYNVLGKNKDTDPGIIMYDVNGTKQMIPYGAKAIFGSVPKYGDKVRQSLFLNLCSFPLFFVKEYNLLC